MLTAIVASVVLSGALPDADKVLGPDKMTLKVAHAFTTQEAHVRLQQLIDYWKNRFGVEQQWAGDRVWVSGSIIGIDFKAFLEVKGDSVQCESTDPGRLWRGFAQDYVAKKLKKYLHPKYEEP